MRLVDLRVLHGANFWRSSTVVQSTLDLAHPLDRPVTDFPGLLSLIAALPHPSPSEPARQLLAEHLTALRSGTLQLRDVPQRLGRVILGLTGAASGWCASQQDPLDLLVVAHAVDDEDVDRVCLEATWQLLARAMAGETVDVASVLAKLNQQANEQRLGPSTRSLILAAEAREIPHSRVRPGYSIVQFGWGRLQRRTWTTETDAVSSLGSTIAANKQLTRDILRRAGVPVAPGAVVHSQDEAWTLAQELGLPVVVKPRDANRGRGVSTGLTSRAQVETAYTLAASVRLPEHADVLVERQIPGDEHRLLVVHGRMIASYRCEPPTVVGDGQRTIAELVACLNRDPSRGTEWRARLSTILLDDQARLFLEARGLSLDSVPAPDVRLAVRREVDRCIDVTDLVHPSVSARAVEAAAVLGLDVAGIDVLALDISRPLEEQCGAIIEVNSGPCLTGHLEPSEGRPRDVAGAILDTLFGPEQNGCIPVIAVAGSRHRSAIARGIAERLAPLGLCVGLAGEHLSRSNHPLTRGTIAEAPYPEPFLVHPLLDVLVIEANSEAIRTRGLGVDRCRIVVLTDFDDAREAPVARLLVDNLEPVGSLIASAQDYQGHRAFPHHPRGRRLELQQGRDRLVDTAVRYVFQQFASNAATSLDSLIHAHSQPRHDPISSR